MGIYEKIRKNKLLNLGRSIMALGFLTMIATIPYKIIKRPVFQENLVRGIVRVYEINTELDRNIRLEDLSLSLIDEASKLKAERDSLESLTDFIEEKERYESRKKEIEKNTDIIFYTGGGLMLASIYPLSKALKKRRIKENPNYRQND